MRVYDLPFKGVKRSLTDLPQVRIETRDGVNLIRARGITIPLTNEELVQLKTVLEATEDVRNTTKLLESYERSAIISLIGQVLNTGD